MDLTERSGGGRMQVERTEALAPVAAELGHHAALDEGRAHRRGMRLELAQLVGIFWRQHVGNGGEQLRHLHDRSFQAAQCGGQGRRVLRIAAAGIPAHKPRAGDPGRDAAHIGTHAGITRSARREAVALLLPGSAGPSRSRTSSGKHQTRKAPLGSGISAQRLSMRSCKDRGSESLL